MKIYTRTGDDGTTSLSGGRRVPKYHPRVEASGSVDELISWIGLLRDFPENAARKDFLTYIQNQLMTCAVALASDTDNKKIRKHLLDTSCTLKIEKEIDKMERKLKPQKSFILPGGNILVSHCHIARCVCRRAEREVIKINQTEKSPQIIQIFLNRLSDYLFILSRRISLELNIQEITWSRRTDKNL